jgi:AcrR family transcriptional regulator
VARPRADHYDAQRARILRAAAALFATHGYTASSMNMVAHACGMTKATLYHYFTDKQSLLLEIAGGHVARLEELAAQPPGQAGDAPDARLRTLIRRFMEAYADAQNAHRVLTEDVRFMDEGPRRTVTDGQRRVVRAFAQSIAACRPDLPAARHIPLAMLLFGMINWTFTWLRPDGPLDHAQVGEMVADLFLGGLPAVRAPGTARKGAVRRS